MSTIATTTTPITIDLRHIARGLDLPLTQVQAVVELLDEGNTVPFVTRYRKDRTGGLDEEKIRHIQAQLVKLRFLADRKQTILRTIEAQGKLTEKLSKQILSANTTKRLEDLYLPFKPKKQTLATIAKTRGLEPLAREILEADPACANLDARAADFVSTDRHVPTAADALLGAGHILAEQFSEAAELRQRLREVFQRTGKLVSGQIAAEGKQSDAKREAAPSAAASGDLSSLGSLESVVVVAVPTDIEPTGEALSTDSLEVTCDAAILAAQPGGEPAAEEEPISPPQTEIAAGESTPPGDVENIADPSAADEVPPAASTDETLPPQAETDQAAVPSLITALTIVADTSVAGDAVAPVLPQSALAAASVASSAPPAAAAGTSQKRKDAKAERKALKEQAKKKREEARLKAYADYYNYREDIRRIPPHRVLALNRGERAKVLRVKIEADLEALYKVLDEVVVPAEHPHRDFLRGCARDALVRLILPSLDREARREMTEKSETHAVGVFARNLRNLLLQPPVRDRRLLALDPGFKSGCKLVALDQFGNVLDHDMMYLVGKPDRRAEAVQKVVALLTKHELQVVVVGNGTGCREAEDFVANLISNELAGRGVAYVIVNEAGASVYSASRVGREEFPQFDATVRGAISIGRRLQDPLSELVKIDAANIGVGLYQHDVKAKHLSTMLDEVVESCVNFVGVDVNTSSPALLRYVSGMNQLTARRVYEQRRQNGPFRSREQLKSVPGFGDATFVQAAGFLKIAEGENPLDATWIHPESYEVTGRVLARLGFAPGDLANKEQAAALAEKVGQLDWDALAKELEVGLLTLKDIAAQLIRPGRDPREDLPLPIFKQGILKLEDLSPGMELTGTVLNVVDFGAFVDIGVHHSGLIHVSQMADKFIRDPHDMVAVGDIVKVWVLEVDKQRRRVSLSMIPPGTPRTHGRHEQKPEQPAQPRPEQAGSDRPPQRRSEQGGRPPFQRKPRSRDQQGPRDRDRDRDRDKSPPPRRAPPPKPKAPLVPLTDEMKEGKVPLRTFGDLMQFYELKKTPPTPEEPLQAKVEKPKVEEGETAKPADTAPASEPQQGVATEPSPEPPPPAAS